MLAADRVCGGDRIIRQLVMLCDRPHQICRRLPVRELLSQKRMKHCPRSIERLKLVLNVERIKDISRIIHRQMGGVCIIWLVPRMARGNDVTPLLPVMLCKPVGRALRRRRLEIIQVAILLLIIRKTFTHMVQHFFCKLLCLPVREIFLKPFCIEPRLIHADEPNRRKMVVKPAQIPLCIRIQPLLQKP